MIQHTRRMIGIPVLLMLAALQTTAFAAQHVQAPAGSPPAKETTETPAPLFDQLDSNHDGFVTVEEAKRSAEVTARFKNLDLNRDAKVSEEEFKKGMQEKVSQ